MLVSHFVLGGSNIILYCYMRRLYDLIYNYRLIFCALIYLSWFANFVYCVPIDFRQTTLNTYTIDEQKLSASNAQPTKQKYKYLTKFNDQQSIDNQVARRDDKQTLLLNQKPVSFNFQNIDIRILFQLLAQIGNVNIIINDNVTGNISIQLDKVAWRTALNTILDSKGLGVIEDENVFRVAPIDEIIKINKQKIEQKNYDIVDDDFTVVTIKLKYADAKNIKEILENPLISNTILNDQLLTHEAKSSKKSKKSYINRYSKGLVLLDSRTNSLIINDTKENIANMVELLKELDVPMKQILIEAKIVEASSNFEKNLGAKLLLAGMQSKAFNFTNSLNNSIKTNTAKTLTTASNTNFGFDGAPSIATIFSPNSSVLIGLELDLLELQNQGRVISNPKIITADNQAANIQQGVQIPYLQSSASGNTYVNFVNATLALNVIPHIATDKYIVLDLKINKDGPSQRVTVHGVPAIDTNSVNTTVRIEDGSTVLVGGIYIDEQMQFEQKVPWLGDIPLLGSLFKLSSKKNSKKELMVFVTPRIIN